MFPEDAVQALFHASAYAKYRNLEEGHVPVIAGIDEERARKYLEASRSVRAEGGWLPPETAIGLLQEYGISAPYTMAALTADEAAAAAKQAGFPVALKLRSTTITHKTDVGGVVLGLRSEDEVVQAFQALKQRMESAGRGGEMEGALVQKMLEGGQEVIVGMSQDPLFGPLIMVGLGGVYVELQKDVAFSLHPLTEIDPDYMLSQLKGLPLLQGWRGSPPKDIEALKEVLLRFSTLIEDFTEIEAAEINPLMVFDGSRGCAAADARIYFRP